MNSKINKAKLRVYHDELYTIFERLKLENPQYALFLFSNFLICTCLGINISKEDMLVFISEAYDQALITLKKQSNEAPN